MEIPRKDLLIPVAVGAVSLAVGFAGGYIYAKKKADVIEEDVDYPVQESPQPTLFDLDVDADEEQFTIKFPQEESTGVHIPPVILQTNEPTPVVTNIFKVDDDSWDYEEELAKRTEDEPYIIHHDEFAASETGFEQETVTYYKGDDITTDSVDTPIYNHAEILGDLKRGNYFGHGSGDPNVVYIRNELLEMEWEVLLHLGKYETEILSNYNEEIDEEDEIRHSAVRKFRQE